MIPAPPAIFDGLRRLARGFASHPAARRRPFRSASNIIAWQIRSRLSRGPHKVQFVNGTALWAERGETGVTGNIYYGLHEFEHMAFVAHALRPGDLFADVGANAGTYTVLAAGVVGARVVAVEPSPEAVDRLRANVALNRIDDRVRIEVCALSDRSGWVRFAIGHDTVNHVAADDEITHTIEVSAKTADDIFAIDVPRILKIDVEGHEACLLRGASRILADRGLWAMSIELGSAESGWVVEMLSRHEFEPRRYDPFQRRLRPAVPSIGDGNTLFLRSGSEREIAERLSCAAALIVNDLKV